MTCTNCEQRPRAKRSVYCWRCLKYRERNGDLPVDPPRQYGEPFETLMTGVRAWHGEDTSEAGDAAFEPRSKNGRSAAEERIAKAAIRYAISLGYVKSPSGQGG